MSSFNREVNADLLQSLKAHSLFKKKIQTDLIHAARNQLRIFPTFRKQVVDFYYGGGRLYRYDQNGFSTHIKYGAVAVKGPKGEYFREADYNNDVIKWPESFEQAHNRIKENCRLFSGVEAEGVSRIYSKHSFVDHEEEYVVLDIEIAFSNEDELTDEAGKPAKLQNQRKTNRIDLLLYSVADRRLFFIEAKHHSNSEIRAKEKPKVVEQLERYNTILSRRAQYQAILKQYGHYIDQANQLFKLSLPRPESIESRVKLLIFGMDSLQLKEFRGTYKNAYKGHAVYHIQNPGKITLKHLWNELLWK